MSHLAIGQLIGIKLLEQSVNQIPTVYLFFNEIFFYLVIGGHGHQGVPAAAELDLGYVILGFPHHLFQKFLQKKFLAYKGTSINDVTYCTKYSFDLRSIH